MKIILVIFLVIPKFVLAAAADDFVITVKTNNPGAGTNTDFIINTNANLSYNYNVDCDNNGVDEVTSQTEGYTCSYPVAGTYSVRIKDNTGTGDGFPAFTTGFGGNFVAEKLLTVEQWGTGNWQRMVDAFRSATNLVFNATDVPDFSTVTNMQGMFYGATSANPDTSNWNTAAVTDMSYMFSNATSAIPDTSNWNTAAVTDMSYMFSNATSANPDTSNWNTTAVADMSFMFSFATSANPDTSNWNTSAATNMWAMFRGAQLANPDVSSWDTAAVTDMSFMFRGAISANPDTSNWDTAAVTNMNYMFKNATSANPDVSSWVTTAVTDMSFMFQSATSANPVLRNWDVSSAADMAFMLWGASTLPTAEYDAILVNYSVQNLKINVNFHAGNSQYCSNAAQTARDSIITSFSWTITDGGMACGDTIFTDGFESTVVVLKTTLY